MTRSRFCFLWLLAQVTRRWKPRGIERLVRWVCDPDQRDRGRIQGILPYEGTLRVKVDTTFFLEWSVFFFGRYEPEVVRMIRRWVPQGGVAFDVGANIGLHTLVMAKAAGDQGRVVAVEPHPGMFQRLLEHLQLNGLHQVVPLQCAFGAAPGRAVLHAFPADQSNQGGSTLCPVDERNPREAVEVQVRTLDEVMQVENLTRLDLIKIDTEGWDFHVLKGGESSLRSFRPVVIFEYAQIGWHGSHTSLESARDWLSSLGYRLFVVTHSRLVPLGQAPFAGCFNLLAVPGASLDQKEMIDAFK